MTYRQANEAGTLVDVTSISVNGDSTTLSTVLSPTLTFTTDAQNPAVIGAPNVNSGDSPNDANIYIRERLSPTEIDRRISSFLNFDVSSLTVADVNNPGFLASFTMDYDFQLNSSNSLSAVVGRVTNSAWDGVTTSPLHSWGIEDAANRTTFITDISDLTPPSSISVDITNIIQDWVEGTTNNFGLAVFAGETSSNAAGFSNPRLLSRHSNHTFSKKIRLESIKRAIREC